MRHILALIVLSAVMPCGGIEPGFYGISDKATKEAFEIEQKADRVLWFGADLKCDLGLGKIQDGLRTPLYLSKDEVEDFLKRERHKAVLVVWCDKTIMWDDRKSELIKEVRSFTSRLGFGHVLILGAHALGVHVIADLKPPIAGPISSANGSQPVRAETNSSSTVAGSHR